MLLRQSVLMVVRDTMRLLRSRRRWRKRNRYSSASTRAFHPPPAGAFQSSRQLRSLAAFPSHSTLLQLVCQHLSQLLSSTNILPLISSTILVFSHPQSLPPPSLRIPTVHQMCKDSNQQVVMPLPKHRLQLQCEGSIDHLAVAKLFQCNFASALRLPLNRPRIRSCFLMSLAILIYLSVWAFWPARNPLRRPLYA